MIYMMAITVLLLTTVAVLCVFLDRAKHKIAEKLVEDALVKVVKNEQEAKDALPDPERELNAKDVSDALARIRSLGRKPL